MQSTYLEIERRFLARVTGDLPPGQRVRQGYLTLTEPSVRIRDRAGSWVLAVKSGRGLVRREVEVAVPPAEGAVQLDMAGELRVDKIRHDAGRWEIDVFQGKLDGLVLAEVELESETETTPDAPSSVVLLRDVTSELTNHWLASLSPEDAQRVVADLYGA